MNVSVILTNYNHGRYLATAIESLLGQGEALAELILVDDGSTDHSREVIESFARLDARVIPVYNAQNLGIAASIQKAVAMARSELISFAAADDFVLSDFLKRGVALFQEHPQARLCLGDYWECSRETRRFVLRTADWGTQARFILPEEIAHRAHHSERINLPMMMVIVRRSDYLALGGHNPELEWHCDWFLFHQLLMQYGFLYLPLACGVMTINSQSYSQLGTRRLARQREVIGRMIDRWKLWSASLRQIMKAPSWFTFSGGALVLALQAALQKPSRWWFLSGSLGSAVSRGLYRQALWDVLWTMLLPFGAQGWSGKMKCHLLKSFAAKVNEGVRIGSKVRIERPWLVVLGRGVSLGRGSQLTGKAQIEIGEATELGQEVLVTTHSTRAFGLNEREEEALRKLGIESGRLDLSQAVQIGSGVVIGHRALILAGATVRDRSLVTAGAVVCEADRAS